MGNILLTPPLEISQGDNPATAIITLKADDQQIGHFSFPTMQEANRAKAQLEAILASATFEVAG